MNSAEFISEFCCDTLGRKTVHGTFRVLTGPHCSILVSSTKSKNKPAGNSLVAIRLPSILNTFVWFCWNHNLLNRVASNVRISKYQSLPGRVFNINIPNLLNSGIVDTSDEYSVIEIGDSPYLFTHNSGYTGRQPKLNQIEVLESRVSTIKEALELVKIPDDCALINKNIIAKPMPNDFVPQEIDKESKQLLITPPSPLDYGYSFEECHPTDNGMLLPMDTEALASPTTTREIEWNKAKQQYNTALALWKTMYPYGHAYMDVKKIQYIMSNTTRGGRLIVSPSGVFFKGRVVSTEFANVATTVAGWHRYMSTKQIHIM